MPEIEDDEVVDDKSTISLTEEKEETKENEVEEIELESISVVKEKSRKLQSHSIVILAQTKMHKSSVAQQIAFETGAILIETENKPPYFKFPKGQVYRVSDFGGMIKAVKMAHKTGKKIVLDSITAPMKTLNVPWNETQEKIIQPLNYIVTLIKERGGIITAHGRWRTVTENELNGLNKIDESKIIDGKRFVLDGKDTWLSIITGTAILGEITQNNPKPKVKEMMMKLSGNYLPEDYHIFTVTDKRKNKFDTKSSPECGGNGYNFLKHLIENPIR